MVLVVFGVGLPGAARRRLRHQGRRGGSTPGGRSPPRAVTNRDAQGDGWTGLQLQGLRAAAATTTSTTTSSRRWPASARHRTAAGGRCGSTTTRRRGQRPVRLVDGADAAAVLDRRVHRLDPKGSSSRRRARRPTTSSPPAAISENAAPPVRQLRSTLNDGAVGVRLPPGPRHQVPDGRTDRRRSTQADAQPELTLVAAERTLAHLRGRRRRRRRAPRRPAGRGQRPRRRPAGVLAGDRHVVVPAARRMGGAAGRRRPGRVAAHRRRRRRGAPDPRGPGHRRVR